MNPGTHVARVLEHSIKISENTGTWSVYVLFELEDSKEKIGGYVWLTDKAMGIARKSLKAIGFDPDAQNISVLDDDPVLLAGNRCQLDIAEETYKDETSMKVKWINPIPKPKSKKSMDQFTTALRNAKKTGAEVGEDIPF